MAGHDATAYVLLEDGERFDGLACGAEAHAGWITLSRDDDAVRVLAPALGIDVRPGSDAF